jgi:uncharacterized protein YyaL (SSP411 family)
VNRFALVLAVLAVTATPFASFAAPAQAAPAFALADDELALYERLRFQIEDAFDSSRGGFVARSGHPSESAIDFAWLVGQRDDLARWRELGAFTVDWMLGLEDTLSGGFYARAERAPGSARIDRPTVLNARRLENLIDAWQATGETRYWVAATRLLEFAERNVVDGRGGFIANPVGDQDLVPEVNGVAVRAWLRWWAAARDVKRRDFARRSLDRVWQTCWDPQYGFMQRDGFGEVLAWPRLGDQVEMGRALVLAAHLGGRDEDLVRARQVADVLLSRYLDPKQGGFVERLETKEGRIHRRAGRPARENARAALFLCELAHATTEARYFEAARKVWRAFDGKLGKAKLDAADWALALDAAVGPSFPTRPRELAPAQGTAPKTSKPGQRRGRSAPSDAKMGSGGD